MAAVADSPPEFSLSREFLPEAEAPVQALCVLDADTVVSGADDRLVTIWKRIPDTRDFASAHVCVEHERGIRALQALPPSEALPHGGFATGSLDNTARIYHADGTPLHQLRGHTGGIMSMALTVDGKQLLTGAWDGTARVWDVATGAAVRTLDGHENATSVLALPNGDIVTGSTGRKNHLDQHVDYKIRIWRGESVVRTITDHTQAVRDLRLLPGGTEFVSVSNDGTIRVWTSAGDPVQVWHVLTPTGEPVFVYRVAVTSTGLILATCEDCMLRVYSKADGLIQEIPHPSVAWGAAELPEGGGLVTSSGGAGTSHRGHIYLWSTDPEAAASAEALAKYQGDCIPPKPKPDEGGAAGGGGDDLPVRGGYGQRGSMPGQAEGEIGLFVKDDGSVMACSWSAETGSWVDVGQVQGPAGGGGGGGGAAGGGAAAAGPPPEGDWDVVRTVTMDLEGGGLKTMHLCFNIPEDPYSITQRFMHENGIPTGYFEQIRNFVLEQRRSAGITDDETGGPPHSRARVTLPTFRHFPSTPFVSFAPFPWDQAVPRILANSEAIAAAGGAGAALALTVDDRAQFNDLVATLRDEGRYHASSVEPAQAAVVTGKFLKWPTAQAAPVVDLVRKACLHDQCARVTLAPAVPAIVEMIERHAGVEGASKGILAICGRLIANLHVKTHTRAAVAAVTGRLLPVCRTLLGHSAPVVRAAGLAALHNVCARIYDQVSNGDAGLSAADADAAAQVAGIAMDAVPGSADDQALLAVCVAGTAACCGTAAKDGMRAAGLADKVAAAKATASGRVAEALEDLAAALA